MGDNGVIVHTADGGQNWAAQTSGTDEKLRAVFFIDANTGWIVGGINTKTMLKTVDGGSTWQDITPGNITNNQLRDIGFADANTGWVIVSDKIYMTKDGGSTWTLEEYYDGVSQLDNKALAVTSDSTAYVAGQSKRSGYPTSYADVLNKGPLSSPEFWGGSVASQFQKEDKLRCIAFGDAATGFAGGQRGIIYKLEQESPDHLNGPWKINLDLEPVSVQVIFSITFPTQSKGMFSTSAETSSTSFALIYHTANAGETWSASPDIITGFGPAIVYAPDTNNAWAVGYGGKIFKGIPSPTGITQMTLDFDVSIYPNPSSDKVYVEINSEENELVNYSLLDITGRMIEKGKWSLNSADAKFTLNLSDVIKGIYLLKLSTQDGQSTFRVVKN